MKAKLKKILGIIFIILGIIGLFLPILQGILFLVLGASLLENKWIIQKVNSIKEKLK